MMVILRFRTDLSYLKFPMIWLYDVQIIITISFEKMSLSSKMVAIMRFRTDLSCLKFPVIWLSDVQIIVTISYMDLSKWNKCDLWEIPQSPRFTLKSP